MTDADRPLTAPDAEALSAYLAGEMGEADAAAFEARMAADPALAQAADALAGALTALHGASDATLPDGFDERLAARLANERRAQPADLGTYRERRSSRSKVWMGVGTAAAVLVAGAVMAGPVLRGLGGGGGTADTVAMDDAREESAAQTESAAGMDAAASAGSAPAGPVLLDEQVAIADEDALRRRYADLPEAAGLIGLSVREAESVAMDYAAVVESHTAVSKLESSAAQSGGGEAAPAEDFDAMASESAEAQDGAVRAAAGDPCLEAISAGARRPLVPVRVETLRYQGQEALAYVLVTAEPGARRLNRTEVWVVALDCSTLVFQQY